MPRSKQSIHDSGHHLEVGCLYQGHVMHMRLTPFVHKFRYRVFTLYLDVDRLAETISTLRLLKLDRFGLLSFHHRDHGLRDGSTLRPWVESLLAEHGMSAPAKIRILAFPRFFGYVFNPLSVYFCEHEDGSLRAIVYEVKNTFGDQHPYVVPIDSRGSSLERHEVDKGFYVSPFIGMKQTYKFTIRQPDEKLSLRIKQHDETGPWLIATQSGDRRPLTDRELLRQWLRHPLMTFKVMVAIHWEALRLAIKGARFHPYRGPYPDPDAASSGWRARIGAIFGWKTREVSD